MVPADSELEVLKALWERSPQSARELHDALAERTGWAVSTTRTVLERMRVKELVVREESHGLAVFSPAQTKVEVLGESLGHLFRNVLEVSGRVPVSAFTGSALLNDAELAELERMLNSGGRG
ncbi:Predicted transcriptional regulator [Luteibacter sp. UNC138MFCol5.1]|uniref:BlaI/MecI/CopY family transcriptional regulator n=1 Tax=Luteibacter sp. UNC138MFCol5.1 TaxID=1502774 RepID=UPI0008CC9470|nr:BlaI/MecI/CopY family transcriptional regulator [Luteibacter sp. UNC138MFCol5.1]SEO64719.1 Predicted transcriptional regulator [Luteibacter sp. UNC138MFCol5.1]